MNDLLNPEKGKIATLNEQKSNQFSKSGLYVREDDQDWGSAGMNDIQKDSE